MLRSAKPGQRRARAGTPPGQGGSSWCGLNGSVGPWLARGRPVRPPLRSRRYLAALILHEADPRPFEQGRTLLLYGEWLRRRRRKADARPRLAAALGIFESLGARQWAARATGELEATDPHRTPEDAIGQGLTPQERQIVKLAAAGLSNKGIAARLFLSPRTVGYHLNKAYPKLGVASRRELAALTPAPSPS